MRAPRPGAKKAKAVLTVTKPAALKIAELMRHSSPGSNGLRLSVRTRGCSGNAFHMEYAVEKKKFDEEVEAYGTKVWIDSNAIMKILGSTMDYVELDLSSEFVFENPNVEGTCGCGESWTTAVDTKGFSKSV